MFKLFLFAVFAIRVSCQQSVTNARYYFFHGHRFGRHTEHTLEDSANIVYDRDFDRNKPTVLYLHGYSESAGSLSVWAIVNAYIVRNDHNILVMDWSKYSDGGYFMNAIPDMQELAPNATRSIISMFDAGLNISKFHIVGHSLGGQFAGLIGRTIINYTNHKYKLKRISALDVASPGFYPGILFISLNPFDADFVDVIHTDAGVFGAPISTGTVDFWPNGGTAIQPGCNTLDSTETRICSHRRSWVYWAESVQTHHEGKFHAAKAYSWFDFISGLTNKKYIGYMGLSARPDMFGNYFLQTNSESPFSRGEQGLYYQT